MTELTEEERERRRALIVEARAIVDRLTREREVDPGPELEIPAPESWKARAEARTAARERERERAQSDLIFKDYEQPVDTGAEWAAWIDSRIEEAIAAERKMLCEAVGEAIVQLIDK